MFGLPADAGWIWLGLLVGSAAMFGVVADLHAAPPDAARVAAAVDEVAAGSHSASGSIDVDAESVKLGTQSVALRGPGGAAHASLDYGPVTPVAPDSDLRRVLEGQPPERLFDTPTAFEATLDQAMAAEAHWRPAGSAVTIRRVRYEEVDGVLVGA